MSRIERTKEIIEKYCQSTRVNSQEIQEEFTYWLTNSRNQKEKDEALFDFWASLDVAQSDFTDVAYKNVKSKIRLKSSTGLKKIGVQKLWKYAATVALIITSLSVFLLYNTTKHDLMVECIVPEGRTCTLTLSDSSLVHLSPKSMLKYPEIFPKDGARRVYLSGEAFFSVQHMDDNNQFMVQTNSMLVRVLGTKFNLSCFDDKETSTLILKEGKVEVALDDKSIVMIPNQKLIYNHSKKSVEITTISSSVGYISLKAASIQDVIKSLASQFDDVIHLNTNKYDQERITVQFSYEESLSDCLHILSLLVPELKYEIRGENVYIE